MKKLASLGLLLGAILLTGCYSAHPNELGWDPAYSGTERDQQIARNWDYEGKQLVQDWDHFWLLRPMGHLTGWNLR